jgi:hypothetical protein
MPKRNCKHAKIQDSVEIVIRAEPMETMDVLEFDEFMATFTRHQLRLLEAVYKVGEQWITRTQIARTIQRKRIGPYDIACLRLLVEKELIIESTKPTHLAGSEFAYIYMMPEAVAEMVQRWAEYRDQQRVEVKPRKPIKFF